MDGSAHYYSNSIDLFISEDNDSISGKSRWKDRLMILTSNRCE